MALAGILVPASAGLAWAQESGGDGLPAGDTAAEAALDARAAAPTC